MTVRIACLIALGVAPVLGAQSSSDQGPTSVWDGIYTQEQAERGKPLYSENCGLCHGADLEGDDHSPALAGSDFLWDWNGMSVGDLFERLRISMPEGDPRSMTLQQKADVLAFMLLRNEFPAGKEELATSAQALRPIRFEAVKQ